MLSWRVTYMERTQPPADGAPPAPQGVTFTRETGITVATYRDIVLRVGEDWLWWERVVLDDAELRPSIEDPGTEFYFLRDAGEFAGFVEIYKNGADSWAIRYFGLLPEFIGRGLGGYMMEALVHAAWRPGVRRITLDTCDLDHPGALGFYRHLGFVETSSGILEAEDPRETGVLRRDAAPHIPLNRQV
jgi:GNAT superfamily N-acetyltransferase